MKNEEMGGAADDLGADEGVLDRKKGLRMWNANEQSTNNHER